MKKLKAGPPILGPKPTSAEEEKTPNFVEGPKNAPKAQDDTAKKAVLDPGKPPLEAEGSAALQGGYSAKGISLLLEDDGNGFDLEEQEREYLLWCLEKKKAPEGLSNRNSPSLQEIRNSF